MDQQSYSQSYTDPAKAAWYKNIVYADRSPDSVIWRVEKKVLAKLVRRHRPGHNEAFALDFACGTGRIVRFMRSLVKRVVGVDISQAMLDAARENVRDNELICADILRSPESVPSNVDIITCFRFLLLAEPQLREDCVRVLATKVRDFDSILVFGLHGNPRSIRFLGALRHRLAGKRLAAFGMDEMRELAVRCGLRIVDVGGYGYLPHTILRALPTWLSLHLEMLLCDRPFIRHFGKNLIVVCKKAFPKGTRQGGQ